MNTQKENFTKIKGTDNQKRINQRVRIVRHIICIDRGKKELEK